MNITSKCADMDIPLYEIFNLNPDDFIDENITDLPFSVRILNRMQGNGVFTLSDLIKKTKQLHENPSKFLSCNCWRKKTLKRLPYQIPAHSESALMMPLQAESVTREIQEFLICFH